jgi:hypothetical protein
MTTDQPTTTTPPSGPSGASRRDDGPDPYRVEALQAAVTENGWTRPEQVITAARAFEAYLRGDR